MVNATSTMSGIMEGCGAVGAALTQVVISRFTGLTFPLFAGKFCYGDFGNFVRVELCWRVLDDSDCDKGL